jgi:hypothetical protein
MAIGNLLKSRVFWLTFLSLIVILVAAYVPAFNLDIEHTAGLAVIVSVFMVSYALSPGDQLKPMLLSRKFWASLLGIVYIFLDAFHLLPIQLDVAQLASLIVVLSAYVIMVAVDPGAGWRGLLVSRKFWLALVGIVFIFLDAYHVVLPAGFTADQIVSIAVLIGGVIAAVGLQKPPDPLPDPVIPEDKEPIEYVPLDDPADQSQKQ